MNIGDLPAPTCETPSRLPDGSRVRVPDGHVGVIEWVGDDGYLVYVALTDMQWFLTDAEIVAAATEWGEVQA